MLFTVPKSFTIVGQPTPPQYRGRPQEYVMPISVTRGRLPTIFIGVWVLTGSAARAQEVASSRDPSPHSARFVAVEANVQVELSFLATNYPNRLASVIYLDGG
jgi:hypothetical protein